MTTKFRAPAGSVILRIAVDDGPRAPRAVRVLRFFRASRLRSRPAITRRVVCPTR